MGHWIGQLDGSKKKFVKNMAKYHYLKISFWLFSMISLISCEQKEIINLIVPEVFVSTAFLKSNGTTIEVNCESINPSSVLKQEFGICWSEKPNPTIKDNYQYSGNNSTEEGPFSEQILNAKPNTTYYIRGYIRSNGKDIYSKDFEYNPAIAKGWNRLEDVPRVNGLLNVPFAYLLDNAIPAFRRKAVSFEEYSDILYNTEGKYWFSRQIANKMIYNQFVSDIEYAPGKFDYFMGGGYEIQNSLNGQKKFNKKASTITYPTIDNYPGTDATAVAFGAGNKGYVIEEKPNPNMYSYNEDDFLWKKMKDPPFDNFTGIKATRSNGNGLVILENALDPKDSLRVFRYNYKTDNWLPMTNFPGKDRLGGVLFSINNMVYFGMGEQKITEVGLKDMWQLDLKTEKWTQIANYPGVGSTNLAFVKKGNSIYIGMGYSSIATDIGTSRKFIAYDFWEFKP